MRCTVQQLNSGVYLHGVAYFFCLLLIAILTLPALGNALSCPLIHEIRAASGMPDLLDYCALMITGPFLLITERGMHGMVRLFLTIYCQEEHDKFVMSVCQAYPAKLLSLFLFSNF